MEILQILGGLACLLAFVAVVGHGLWVAAASLLAGDSLPKEPALRDANQAQSCPRCGLPLHGGHCAACDWPVAGNVARPNPRAALDALSRQIENLNRSGALASDTYQSFSRLIDDQRQRLASAASARVPPPPRAEEPVVEATIVEEATEAPVTRAVATDDREFASDVPVSQRAQVYAAARQEPAVPAPIQSATSQPPPSWTDWLAAFMEERNMRWGELVGGLLIVCCSIALVVSFWSAIAERPWLKFFLFGGVTAGLFGVGLYSEFRWRLHMTSQGLLTIGNLLVPLNFLAIAAFSGAVADDSLLTFLGEVISVGLFAALVYFAGTVLVEHNAAWLAGGVIIPSVAQLLVRRHVDPQSSVDVLAALAALPLVCYLVVNGWNLRVTAQTLVLRERQVNATFKFLGLTTFAALVPLVLLLLKTERPLATLRELPMVAGLLGLVPLGAGLMLWQKLAGRGLANLRTAGTSVAVFGALVSLSGLVLGWPDPKAMLPAAVIEFAVFTYVAWRFALPAGHVVAAACLAMGYLVGVYVADQQIPWSAENPQTLAGVLVSGETATLLAPLVLAYAACAALVRGRGTFRALTAVVAGLAAISVGLASWFGFGVEGDPHGAAWIYLLYAAVCLAVSVRSPRVTIAWIGAVLLLAAVMQATVFGYAERLGLAQPALTAILLFCTLAIAVAIAVRATRLAVDDSPLAGVLCSASFASSLAVASRLVFLVDSQSAAFQAGHWFWLAAVWLAVAGLTGWLSVWTLFQLGLVAGTVFGAVAPLEGRTWFGESRQPWLDPWTLVAVGIGLVGLNLAWAAVRIATRRFGRGTSPPAWSLHGQRLLASPWLAVDRVTSGAVVALLAVIAAYAAIPGIMQELSPRIVPASSRIAAATPEEDSSGSASSPTAPNNASPRRMPPIENFEWRGVAHAHAAGWGSWTLLACVLVLLAAMAREENAAIWLLCLLLALAACCPLLASRWESDVAVASALRWLSAGWMLLGSAPIWARTQIARLGWRPVEADWDIASYARNLVLFLGLGPLVAIMAYIAARALVDSPTAGGFWHDSYALAIVGGISGIVAGTVWVAAARSVTSETSAAQPRWPWAAAALLLVLGTAPIVSLMIQRVGIALDHNPILGPDPVSIFARMGPAGSYAVPIVLSALVLVGYALRDRSSGFALAGGLVLNASATVAYLLATSQGGALFDAVQWIRMAQLNATVAACYALLWLAAMTRFRDRSFAPQRGAADFPFSIQAALAPALLSLPLGWAWCSLAWEPKGSPTRLYVMNVELADAYGWVSLVLACAGVLAAGWVAGRRRSMLFLSASLTAIAIFAAVLVSPWDIGNWVSYNTLLVGHGAIAAVLLAAAWGERHRWFSLDGEPSDRHVVLTRANPTRAAWIVLQGTLVAMLAARELVDNRWWPAGALAFLGVLLGPALAWVFQQRRYLYAAAILINVAGLLAWTELKRLSGIADFVYANAILLALPVVPWLLIELHGIRRRQFNPRIDAPPPNRVATRGALLYLVLAVGYGLAADAGQAPWAPWSQWALGADPLNWIALAVTAVAALACLWDVEARDSIAGLYVLGLVAGGMLLDQFDLTPPWLLWTGTMVAASYAVLTSYLWSRRRGLLMLADRLRIPRGPQAEFAGLGWLVPCNVLLVTTTVAMTFVVELTSRDAPQRVLAAQATLAQVISLALLARGDRRGVLQMGALALGAVGAVMFGWAWLKVGTTLTLLNALVVVAAATATVGGLYGFGLSKFLREDSDWLAPARRLTPWLAGVSALAILATLGVEIYQFSQTGAVEIAWPAIVVVAVTLAGLFLAALAAAILPGRDPLGLSERGRTAYVYGAEVILALLFVHVRLSMPWLFTGLFQQYWPLVVMAIAFLGVGFAEFCRRRRQEVLAEPLQNTGALLPVLPVLGYWASDSRVDYSMLLLCVGLLYAGLSIARRSFGFGILAALAANGGLWYFLNRQDGFDFLTHPQIWLIPPAVCVLAAAYLNRGQLAPGQMTAIRYVTSMSIYLSSTADVFLNGVAQQPWLPLVLAGFSLLGILLGIVLCVRAFLFLGTGFLAMSLFTIIWHAAVDLEQTWLWYASGIVSGVLILALFAMFEKKRQGVLDLVDKIKAWEG